MGKVKKIPRHHSVAIIDEGSSCKITPGEILAAKVDTVSFHNLTGDDITIMFPDGNLFGKTTYPIKFDEAIILPVFNQAVKQVYTYTVYCNRIQGFAHATIPRIIIYDDMV
jgi:hypothetical protein